MIISESKSENKSTEAGNTGGAVDNNMNNVGNAAKGINESKEQKTEYKVGKIETKTINAQGELNKITASVAIDGNLDALQTKNVKNMVANTIGMKKGRGDNIVVVGMNFNTNDDQSMLLKLIRE